jgi:hypothetical protein
MVIIYILTQRVVVTSEFAKLFQIKDRVMAVSHPTASVEEPVRRAPRTEE